MMSKSLLTRLATIAVVSIAGVTLTGYIAWNPYLELVSHFKLQYLVVSLICVLIIMLSEWRKKWFFVALFCLSIQSIEIIPWYFPPSWIGSDRTPNLRIMLSNVYEKSRTYEKVLSSVRDEQPDIAIFQEVTSHWAQQLQVLSSTFPYSFQAPETMVVYSRFPLDRPILFGTTTKPSIASHLTIDGRDITLVVTHPLPPTPNSFASRNQQLLEVGQYVQQQKNPVILVGDLNTTMWSPYYHKLIQDTGLKDARKGFGLLPSWPVPTPYASNFLRRTPIISLFKIPIDHCLLNSSIEVTGIHTGHSVGSDRLPLIVDLSIPPKST